MNCSIRYLADGKYGEESSRLVPPCSHKMHPQTGLARSNEMLERRHAFSLSGEALFGILSFGKFVHAELLPRFNSDLPPTMAAEPWMDTF